MPALDLKKHALEQPYPAVVSNLLFRDIHTDKPLVSVSRDHHQPDDEARSATCSVADAARTLEKELDLYYGRDFVLLYRGKSYRTEGTSEPRVVHPFSWRLIDRSWADSAVQKALARPAKMWYSPEHVHSGKLEKLDAGIAPPSKSISRVWLHKGGLFSECLHAEKSNDPGHLLESTLKSMRNDQDSGACYMATTALQRFRDIVGGMKQCSDSDILWYQSRMAAWHLINNGRPSMNAAIQSNLLLALSEVSPMRESQEQMVAHLDARIATRKAIRQRICESFAAMVQRRVSDTHCGFEDPTITILTLSCSINKCAILTTLKRATARLDVRILESRPLCEGAKMAAALMSEVAQEDRHRVSITVATDASVALLMRGVDYVLLGADKIRPDGSVSNKTGSYTAAICARVSGARTVVLSGMEKVMSAGSAGCKAEEEEEEEENGPDQVWRIWEQTGCGDGACSLTSNDRVKIMNEPFEWVPEGLVDAYITEEGITTLEQIQAQALRIQALDHEIFDDL